MSPLELNAVPLSSELHSPVMEADNWPGSGTIGAHPVKKTSLSELKG